MSELHRMLRDLADGMFGEQCTLPIRLAAEAGSWPSLLWSLVEQAGLPLAAVPPSLGGAGTTLQDATSIARAVGAHALPLPVTETILANWLLAQGGRAPMAGPLGVSTVAGEATLRLEPAAGGFRVSGAIPFVPWGRNVGHVVAVAARCDGSQAVVALAAADCRIERAESVAGEPRDHVVCDGVRVDAPDERGGPGDRDLAAELLRAGALLRCHQMAGAMDWVLERSCGYVGERTQFGRPIGRFQAVQHLIATMATHVSAASAAADGASAAFDEPRADELIGFAKSRVGEAAGEVTAIAHQVHGAMGYSREYALHFRTRRIWSWREEFGGERFWQTRNGQRIAARGADALWAHLAV